MNLSSRLLPPLFLIPLMAGLVFSQSVNLPLNHWAYAFLDRLEVKGLYSDIDFSMRPFSRATVANIILQIDAKLKQEADLLSAVERDQFEQLKGEFYEELRRDQGIDIDADEHERHILNYRTEELNLHLDLLVGQQFNFETKRRVDASIPESVTSWGYSFRASLKERLAIYSEGQAFILSDVDSLANTVFNPSSGLPVTRKALADLTITDNAAAYVSFPLLGFDMEIGRNLVEWGPGFRGTLALSRNSNYYDLFKTTLRQGRFQFEYLHAFLNADRTKYLAGHRLEVRLAEWLRAAVHETVIYGDRDVEFLYANPFVPIIIAERHIGNQDNNLMGFDITWFWFQQRMKLYSEILFDDFSFAKDLFGSFGNKWAVQFGVYWADPLGLQNTDFRFEFNRVQPFVYSHRNETNTYSNYNNSLGHWLGPDADDIYVEMRKRMHRNLQFGVFWERRRRGQNDITQGERPPDGRFKFLDGVVERNLFYGLLMEWQVMRDLFVTGNYSFIDSRNLRQVEGINQKNHRFLINFSLNF